jgi:hypothetical protein
MLNASIKCVNLVIFSLIKSLKKLINLKYDTCLIKFSLKLKTKALFKIIEIYNFLYYLLLKYESYKVKIYLLVDIGII